jgi:thymidylate synthase (FAD)
MDRLFRVEVISQTANPQRVICAALRQDYAENFIYDAYQEFSDEEHSGELIVKHLLAGGRGHYGPLEHPQIVFNCGWFPHSTMQQLRTHRVGISFDVQSFRYTGTRILDVVEGERDIEEVFYVRPVGEYTDRQGKHYKYSEEQRQQDLHWCIQGALRYHQRIVDGCSEEHARGLIPFDVRQHFVMSVNVRSLMHLLDLRAKSDAQLECQQFCDLLWPHFENWCPQIAEWYKQNRWKKAKLSP